MMLAFEHKEVVPVGLRFDRAGQAKLKGHIEAHGQPHRAQFVDRDRTGL
ncbi:MAG: hypothetical protein L0Y43_11945 [Methylococcaceae bacterium]|nr:hypothetical protein [Methylococcaceae bacterium]